MIIGIDYRLAASTHRGFGRYSREIVEKLFTIDKVNQYILYVDTDCNKQLPPNFRWRKIPTSNYILGEQIYMPLYLRQDKVDVMWSTSNTFPLFVPSKIKLVVTVHDLIFMYKLPKNQSLVQRIGALYRRAVIVLGKNIVDKYITVSNFSASELDRILNIKDSTVTYNCIESFYKKAQTHTPPPCNEEYYFTLSADAPSKNLDFLLTAFKNKLTDKKLIVGGVKDKSQLRIRYAAPNIIFLKDGVPDSELIDHYMNCKAFIYVSIQEGFGIPPLEALACGAKVICSNATSLPEVLGDNGLLINPKNEEDLIDKIKNIDNFNLNKNNVKQHLEQFIDWSVPAKIVADILQK